MASKLGVTGFQASCADLDILRRTRELNGPFVIIKAEDELYPQYDNREKLAKCQGEWEEWIAAKAKLYLAESGDTAAPRVVEHWKKLANETGVDGRNEGVGKITATKLNDRTNEEETRRWVR